MEHLVEPLALERVLTYHLVGRHRGRTQPFHTLVRRYFEESQSQILVVRPADAAVGAVGVLNAAQVGGRL